MSPKRPDESLRRSRRLAQGLCAACGKAPHRPSKVLCQACADKPRNFVLARNAERQASGQCLKCGQVLQEKQFRHCVSCRAEFRSHYDKQGRQDLVGEGKCFRCRQVSPLDGVQLCETCWFSYQASKNFRDPDRKKRRTRAEIKVLSASLRDLWFSQEKRCALSGRVLVPGKNMSIDHIVPRSAGGLTVLENIRWVDTAINQARGVLSDPEYLAQCLEVVNYLGSSKSKT